MDEGLVRHRFAVDVKTKTAGAVLIERGLVT